MDFFYRYKSYYRRIGMGTPILDAIIFRKMRSLVGGRIRLLLSGGAPLSPDIHDYVRYSFKHLHGHFSNKLDRLKNQHLNCPAFLNCYPQMSKLINRCALTLPLVQGYGLTESCACGTIMDSVSYLIL